MDQVASPELVFARDHFSPQAGPLAFLDTGIILDYLQGDSVVAQLFSAHFNRRLRFAVNAIVLQELLLNPDAIKQPEFESVRDDLQVIPLNTEEIRALLPQVKALNKRVHSNDILILSSADHCDFLVTRNTALSALARSTNLRAVTPEQLLRSISAA